MAAQWIQISSKEGPDFKGYLSLPPTGSGPGVILIQEIFGVNHHIQAVADQYALDGYTVLAPDLFWRIKPGISLSYREEEWATAFGYMKQMDFGLAVQDLVTATQTLRGRPECTGKVASLGYCLGGLLSYFTGANAEVDATVCYYPGSIDQNLDQIGKIRGPILIHFAGADEYIGDAAIAATRKAFEGRKQTQIEHYPGVQHGFNCWERPMYNQQASALAHGKTLQFLSFALSGQFQ
ncbi:dienelactone hydrolase family protein [Chitinimonas sp.]|uniref:dienelactone hydrolase family protein n=1 Tax=Chitinimonas sp. TaxID=1934313 RepID=UPI002F91D3E1